VALTGPLRERRLYDLALAADTEAWRTVAAHAVYFRSVWHDFGLAHITDTHVARRIDRFRPTLYDIGRDAAGQPPRAAFVQQPPIIDSFTLG
jgi:hypothetical protein